MTEEEFIQLETKNLNFLNKLAKTEPIIYNTKNLQFKDFIENLETEIVLKPSLMVKFLFYPFLILELYFVNVIVYLIFQSILFPINILFFLLISFFLLKTLIFLFGKKYNYKIILNSQFLSVENQIFEWHNISETLIQVESLGKKLQSILVVLTKSNEIFKFSLFNFKLSNNKLSYIIEHYKRNNVAQHRL